MAASPFEVFGLQPRFGIDLAQLKDRHRDLSKALHPDKHAAATPAERRLALSRAIEANEAFRTLNNPISRAEAVLLSRGISEAAASAAKPDEEFLFATMELREELAEARVAKNVPAVATLRTAAEASQRSLVAELTAVLDSPEGDVERAIWVLAKLRYAVRFLEEISTAEDVLTP